MDEAKKDIEMLEERGTVTLPCGCKYQDKGWLLTRINQRELHRRKRTAKRLYRPKAGCVRP